jgi:phage terminase large subunit
VVKRCLKEETFVVCVRENQKSLDQSVKKLIEDKIQDFGLGGHFRILNSHIEPAVGGRIIFQGMQNHTAESIKSLEGYDIAWVEEAQSLSQRSLDLLRPTIRKDGSELWFSWNPNLPTDPVDVLLRGEHPPPDAIVVQANYRDNPWLPDVLRAELEYDQRRDPDKFAHIWLGGYQRNSEARVFKNWRVEEFESPSNVEYRLGADFGFSTDPSCAVRCFVDGTRLYIDYEAWGLGVEIVNLPKLFMSIPDAEKYWMTADSSRPDTISHLRKHGFPRIMPAVKGARSLEEGIEFLKGYDIIVHPRCQHTIDELTLYSFKVDKLTSLVTNELEDKDNHLIDSLRYANEGARRALANKPRQESVSIPSLKTAFNRRG